MTEAPPEGTKERRSVADIKALEARLSGASYSVIQKMNNYKSRTDARDAVKRAIKKHHVEPLQERIVIVLARYERMLLALWKGVLAGDIASIREARAITETARANVASYRGGHKGQGEGGRIRRGGY
jgi:hypothetical protein